MSTRIVFNGKEYQSLDEMPTDVRQAYDQLVKQLGDADHDGIPDILQHDAAARILGSVKLTQMRITINGKTYESASEMPAEVRQLYDKAMAQAGGGQGSGAETV